MQLRTDRLPSSWKCALPYGETALSMLLMGSSLVVSKVIAEGFPVILASALRLLLSALLQLTLFFALHRGMPRLTRRDMGVLLFQSLFGVALYSVFFMEGLKRTTALEAGIFSSLIPAAGGLVSIWVFHERPSGFQCFGILAAVSGTLLINIGSTGSPELPSHLLGNVMILASSFCQAVFVTFGKLVSPEVSPLFVSGAVSSLGAAMLALPALHEALTADFSKIHPQDWGWVLYLGLVCTGAGVMLMNHGSRRLSPLVVSIFTALNPVSAILLSVLFLKEEVTGRHIGGMAIIGAGIAVSLFRDQMNGGGTPSRRCRHTGRSQ